MPSRARPQSDLTELKNHIFGLPQRSTSQAQEFGTRFHDQLLLDSDTVPTGKGAIATRRMLDIVRADAFFARLLPEAELETPQFWNDEQTGLPCKARLDIRLPGEGLIVDVKTTSARSQREFESNCYRYEYDGCGRPSASRLLPRRLPTSRRVRRPLHPAGHSKTQTP